LGSWATNSWFPHTFLVWSNVLYSQKYHKLSPVDSQFIGIYWVSHDNPKSLLFTDQLIVHYLPFLYTLGTSIFLINCTTDCTTELPDQFSLDKPEFKADETHFFVNFKFLQLDNIVKIEKSHLALENKNYWLVKLDLVWLSVVAC
jgi:hypothetical protein